MDPTLRRMVCPVLAFLLLLEGGMLSLSSPPPAGLLGRLWQHIDHHQDELVQALKEWVAVESDSVQPLPRLRQELSRMMGLASERLRNLGASVDAVDLGTQQLPDGQTLPLPPILLAELGDDPRKPTVCFYGHLDVQPARAEDGWLSDPYTLTELDGKLYGRGTTDNKGPVLAWINAVGTFRALKQVKCRDQDFHSGTFGGILHEPMTDLVALLGSLVDSSGHILIPGIYDQVDPVMEEEKAMYEAIDLDLEEYRHSSRVRKFLFDSKEEILMHLWRYPSLSIHGIEGAFDEPGAKTVIPGRVLGKFSIRLVPHMNTTAVEKQVKQHLEHVFSARNSANQVAVSMTLGLQPWVANVRDRQYLAARRAIRAVFGTEPDMIRDGSTIPIARIFQDTLQKSVMMLPLGAVDDGEHSQNEKINRRNYIEGSKLFAAFFLELAELHQ
ncbi:beta-Ala-His dipeptidase isoform X3 [Erinaceus europaeus]|uniref:Beta-Ala-His dipeptidase isoform X3 n=1 Tax=Erinaceus europaeus TaxID=9365 RepID=A0ABM3WVJ0_ERIEU|nr:beta-Ala-His dipeptidase isoform X3 [Erinaceus europaeus]